MGEWKEYTLIEISSDISYGYTASASQDKVGPKFLRITDIVPYFVDWVSVPYCEIEDKKYKKYKLYKGDIVVARTGATTGYNQVIKNNVEAVYASYLIRYRINDSIADSSFIGYVLQSPSWYDYVDAIKSGSAQPGANAKQLGAFEIPLPPLPEQRAIAGVLSSLDAKIDLLHRQNATLEGLAEVLWREWFGEERAEGDGWEEGVLGDLVNLRSGKSRPKNLAGDIPIYGGNGILGFTGKSNSNTKTIIIGRVGAYCGSLYYENRPIWVSDNALKCEAKNIAFINYIFYFLKTQDLNGMAEGSSHPLLTQTLLKSIPVLIPSDVMVEKFNLHVGAFLKKKDQNKEQITVLENLRDTLLPKLMSGEVRVG